MSFINFIDAAKDAGWQYEPCGLHPAEGGWRPNPAALDVGGARYPTLVRGCVRAGFTTTELYYHDGRVWWGDPTVQRDDQVTLAGLVVDEEVRRQGIGTEAVRDLKSIAGGLGISIMLEARPMGDYRAKRLTSKALVRWYKSLGFVPAYPGEGETILVWRHV